jgi:hypothetical protein
MQGWRVYAGGIRGAGSIVWWLAEAAKCSEAAKPSHLLFYRLLISPVLIV